MRLTPRVHCINPKQLDITLCGRRVEDTNTTTTRTGHLITCKVCRIEQMRRIIANDPNFQVGTL